MSQKNWKFITAISLGLSLSILGLWLSGKSFYDLFQPQRNVIETASMTILWLEKESSLVTARAYVQAVIRKRDVQWYGDAELIRIVPATISYSVNLAEVDRMKMEYDGASKTLRIPLPGIQIQSIDPDMANAETIRNLDLLRTESLTGNILEDETEKMIRPKIEEMGRSPLIIKNAKEQAIHAVRQLLEGAFRAAGMEVRVMPYFVDDPSVMQHAQT